MAEIRSQETCHRRTIILREPSPSSFFKTLLSLIKTLVDESSVLIRFSLEIGLHTVTVRAVPASAHPDPATYGCQH